jgi:phenylalanine-4-hydroxylase
MYNQVERGYSEEDQIVWTSLYSRIMQMLPEVADSAILTGLKRIGYPAEYIPKFSEINQKINSFTDWEIVPMAEMVPDHEFIGMLADKKYPSRNWLRNQEQVDTDQDEYDMFHDIIGHTPLLTIPNYCYYLQGLGKLALEYIDNNEALLFLKRMYWHTIQFGLIISDNSLKIYGAHLISSRAETLFSISAGVPKYDFDVAKIMDTPYVKGSFQERYFVINSYQELYDNLPAIREELKQRVASGKK